MPIEDNTLIILSDGRHDNGAFAKQSRSQVGELMTTRGGVTSKSSL
jgi:hypothetical protein